MAVDFLDGSIGFELLLLEMTKWLFLIGLPVLTLFFFLIAITKTSSRNFSTRAGLKMLLFGLLRALVVVLIFFALIMVLSVCTFRDGDA